jgi:uncharacterized membrane-anchored protein
MLALALAVQLAIIGSIALSHYVIRDRGQVVLLAIEPVDPRDPLRGDYLTYTFPDLSEVPAEYFEGGAPKPGEAVWMRLERRGGISSATYGSLTDRPPEGDNSVFIRGTVIRSNNATVAIRYGIEEYFVPEGAGTVVPPMRRMKARAYLADDGRATLDTLLLDGQPWP